MASAKGAIMTYTYFQRSDHSTNDNVFFFFNPVVSTSALSCSCLLFPFRAEVAEAEAEGASLVEGRREGSSTPAGFINALPPVLVDFGTDVMRLEDKEPERRSMPTLLLSYITRLAGSLSFFDGLTDVLVELDIDLIFIFRDSSGWTSVTDTTTGRTSGGLDDSFPFLLNLRRPWNLTALGDIGDEGVPISPPVLGVSESEGKRKGIYDLSYRSSFEVELDARTPSANPQALRISGATSHSASSLTCAFSSSTSTPDNCCALLAFCIKRRFKVPVLRVFWDSTMVVDCKLG